MDRVNCSTLEIYSNRLSISYLVLFVTEGQLCVCVCVCVCGSVVIGQYYKDNDIVNGHQSKFEY